MNASNISGVGVSPGRVIGPVKRLPDAVAEPTPGQKAEHGVDEEKSRLIRATEDVRAELRKRASRASASAQAVLEATALMAADPTLLTKANAIINAGGSAERAIWEAGGAIAEQLKTLGGYMAERATDVLDVRSRIVAQLQGLPAPGIPDSPEPFVLAARDLAPADTATLDPTLAIALITSEGGPQSHTAILARDLGIPAIVAAPDVEDISEDTVVFVDGASGSIVVDPGEDQRSAVSAWQEQSARLAHYSGDAALRGGEPVQLLANVGGYQDAETAVSAGADGIGLFRTEFLFLDATSEPTIEEQRREYGRVFSAFEGKKVVVRTLDAGADKPLSFLTTAEEPNPALGTRGWRTSWSNPGVLERQLTAIAAAAGETSAEVWVMAPMISTPQDAEAFAELCREHSLAPCGAMVEVPAAALCAGAILEHADFVSLGTNDLTQYTMAADRQIGTLAALNDPWQPAVLSLIAMTARAADESGKPVSVCGEAASDPALAVVLAGLGIRSLSMSPKSFARVAAALRTVYADEAATISAKVLSAPTAIEARKAALDRLPIIHEMGLS